MADVLLAIPWRGQCTLLLHAARSEDEVLVFLKWYEPQTAVLEYVRSLSVARSTSIGEIANAVREYRKLAAGTPLLVFNEVRAEEVIKLELGTLISDVPMRSGDILVFQVALEEADKRQCKMAAAPAYFSFLVHRVTVRFRDLKKPKEVPAPPHRAQMLMRVAVKVHVGSS